jgi:hypothetical protein
MGTQIRWVALIVIEATIRTGCAKENAMTIHCPGVRVLLSALMFACFGVVSNGQPLRRATINDLKLGAGISEQPSPDEFKGVACGSNGGPPRQQLLGWNEFKRCRAEPSGLHEVYFEYDDELEYIARARDLEREITRWAGTTEAGFSVIVSALFDNAGILRGIRIVTDSRPEHRNDITDADLRKRSDAYLFGGVMAARYDIEAGRDCKSLPAAEGESAIGELFVKQRCERTDPGRGRKVVVQANLFRKPGQNAVNPRLPSQLTEGQFESSARVEIFQVPTQ